jgi:hypothetical protein
MLACVLACELAYVIAMLVCVHAMLVCVLALLASVPACVLAACLLASLQQVLKVELLCFQTPLLG